MARKESLVAVLFESLGHESFEAHLHVYPCDVKLINLECVLSNISVSIVASESGCGFGWSLMLTINVIILSNFIQTFL